MQHVSFRLKGNIYCNVLSTRKCNNYPHVVYPCVLREYDLLHFYFVRKCQLI
jgi:hypothetical protein